MRGLRRAAVIHTIYVMQRSGICISINTRATPTLASGGHVYREH
jgi:hypothetical protein